MLLFTVWTPSHVRYTNLYKPNKYFSYFPLPISSSSKYVSCSLVVVNAENTHSSSSTYTLNYARRRRIRNLRTFFAFLSSSSSPDHHPDHFSGLLLHSHFLKTHYKCKLNINVQYPTYFNRSSYRFLKFGLWHHQVK